MNPKIERITNEIEKLRSKMSGYQNRLRELERQKTELENADIIAAVRGVDVAPDELAAFIRMLRAQQGGALPNLDASPNPDNEAAASVDTDSDSTENPKNDKEDFA